MEHIIIVIINILVIVLLWFVLKIDLKKAKDWANNEELNNLTKDLPDNIQVCRQILKDINNETVEVQETIDKKSGTSLYIAVSNKILIANLKNSFTRFQTIAHECRHSIQNKKLQLSQFVLANLYKISFIVIIILQFIYKNISLYYYLGIIFVLGTAYQIIKYVLEKDAIINSKDLAINYLKLNTTLKENVIKDMENQYLQINKMGVNFILFTCVSDIAIRIGIVSIINMFCA